MSKPKEQPPAILERRPTFPGPSANQVASRVRAFRTNPKKSTSKSKE